MTLCTLKVLPYFVPLILQIRWLWQGDFLDGLRQPEARHQITPFPLLVLWLVMWSLDFT
jgi:hypothetical protein